MLTGCFLRLNVLVVRRLQCAMQLHQLELQPFAHDAYSVQIGKRQLCSWQGGIQFCGDKAFLYDQFALQIANELIIKASLVQTHGQPAPLLGSAHCERNQQDSENYKSKYNSSSGVIAYPDSPRAVVRSVRKYFLTPMKQNELFVVLVSVLQLLEVAAEVVEEVGQDAALPAAKVYFATSVALVASWVSVDSK